MNGSTLTNDQLNYIRDEAERVPCEIQIPFEVAPEGYEWDPVTECHFDPENGYIFDPDNGYIFDPESGYIFDPENVQIFDPENAQIFDPENVQIFDSENVFDPDGAIGVLKISDGIYDSYGNRINLQKNLSQLIKLLYFTFKYKQGALTLKESCRPSST